MSESQEEQLKTEIQHIFDSGANEIRVFEMVKTFISNLERNEEVNADNIKKTCSYVNYDLSLKVMDIRSKEVSDKYREAKKFVEEYEENYHAEINKESFFDVDIWGWRNEIQELTQRLINSGQLGNSKHPYSRSIENRRRYIKEKLKIKFKK